MAEDNNTCDSIAAGAWISTDWRTLRRIAAKMMQHAARRRAAPHLM